MHETAAEQKESRSPEAPADMVILFILMNTFILLFSGKKMMSWRSWKILWIKYIKKVVCAKRRRLQHFALLICIRAEGKEK